MSNVMPSLCDQCPYQGYRPMTIKFRLILTLISAGALVIVPAVIFNFYHTLSTYLGEGTSGFVIALLCLPMVLVLIAAMVGLYNGLFGGRLAIQTEDRHAIFA